MEETTVLLRAYARAQERCSRLLAEQAAQIVRLRAALIVRDSALAMVREELAVRAATGGTRSSSAAHPSPPAVPSVTSNQFVKHSCDPPMWSLRLMPFSVKVEAEV